MDINSSYSYSYYDDPYENYTYNFDESLLHLPLHEFVPVVIFYVLTGLVGLVGNTLVVFAIVNFPRMRSITNWFLLSLACADLLLVLICIPVKCAGLYSFTWQMGGFLCTFVAYIQNVSMICSIMTLTVMSIERLCQHLELCLPKYFDELLQRPLDAKPEDQSPIWAQQFAMFRGLKMLLICALTFYWRFLAILFPLKARYICTMNHTRVVIVAIWFLSFLMAVPIIFGKKIKEVGTNYIAHWCIIQFSPTHYLIYELYMFVIMFVIPVLVMAVSYTMISIEIYHIVSNRAMMRSGSECQYTCTERGSTVRQSVSTTKKPPAAHDDDARTRKQVSLSVILMLIIVVVLFAICWGPILVNNLLVAFGVLSDIHMGFLKPMRTAFMLMSYANSCINPIVYGFMSKNFRDTFKYAINHCLKRGSAMTRLHVTDITRGSILKSSNSAGSDEKDAAFTRVDNGKGTYTAVEMKPI